MFGVRQISREKMDIRFKNMKVKTLKYLAGYWLLFIISTQNLLAQNMATPPNGLIIEGIPNFSETLVQDFSKVTDRTLAGLVNWKKDGSLIGYTEYYSPFFLSADGKRKDFQVYPPSRLNLALQPDLEQSFLFTKDKNGSETAQLYQFETNSGETVQLTNLPDVQNVTSYLWSKKGDLIYFINGTKEKNEAEIYVLNPNTKEKKLLTKIKEYARYLLDTDGENLLFYHYISNSQTNLFLLNLKTLEVSQISNETAVYRGAKFSKSSNGIWWLSNQGSEFASLYFFDLNDKSIKKINSQEMNISAFAFSLNEKNLALKINDSGLDSLRIFEMDGTKITKELEKPSIPVGLIERISWRNNEELGFSFESNKNPIQTRTYNISTKTQQILAKGEGNQQIIDNLEDTQQIRWKSFDNREITGFLIKPQTNNQHAKLPVIIDIHGGPASIYQPIYSGFKSYPTVNIPIVTIFPNIRGSSGFGKEFQNLDDKEKREDAIKDIEALLDWIETQPQLDSKKVVVKGASYGSFVALAVGLRQPKRVKAVIAESPVISIKNTINYTPKSIQDMQFSEYGSANDEVLMDKLEKLSPLNKENLPNWKLPLFLAIGENDVRVPVQDVILLKDQLKAMEIPVWLIKAPKEGHIWSNYENKIFLNVAEIVFIKKYIE